MSIILPALTALIFSASAAKRPVTFPADTRLTTGQMENFRDVFVNPNKIAQILSPLTNQSKSRPRAVIKKDKVEINEHIFFATASDKIKPSSLPILAAVASALKNNDGVTKLQVQGHTDSIGEEDSNLTLSIRRAQAVRSYLIAQGVSADRLDSTGFGEARPLNALETPDGHQANRRVEFVIQRWSDVPRMQEVQQIGQPPAPKEVPTGTSLEIANLHQIPADVTVNGQKVGSVGPTTVAAIHGLKPGLYDVGFTHPTGYTYYRAVRTSKIASPIVPGGEEAKSILPNRGLPVPAK